MTSDAPDHDLTASEAGAGAGEGGNGPRPDSPEPAPSAPDGEGTDSGRADREPTTPTVAPSDTPGPDGEAASTEVEPTPTPAAATGDTPGADGGTGTVPRTDEDSVAAATPTPVADVPPAGDLPGDDEEDEEEADPTPATGAAPRRRPLPAWAQVVAGIAVLAVLGGAYWLGQRDASQPEAPATTPSTAAPEGDDPAGTPTTTSEFELAEYEDAEDGFSFSYPAEWEFLELTGEDPNVRLVLSAGGQDSFLVRVEQLDSEVTTDQQLVDINAVTDGAIAEVEGARILQEQQIELGGLPGYYYLYQFTDSETGLEGAHVHYFLFQGSTMYVLVFQALPTENFEPLVPAFDVVTESFRVDEPDDEPDDEATTTTAGEPDDGATTTTTAPPTTPTG